MKMSDEKKKEMLLINFEILKDNFYEHENAICEIIEKMFKVDNNMAVDMWLFILEKHQNILSRDWNGAMDLIFSIAYAAEKALGRDMVNDIVLNNPVIKKSFFSLACYPYPAASIIQDKVISGDLQVADELLQLLYENPYKERSWYDVMKSIMPEGEIKNYTFDFLEMWCDKAVNESDRAKLNVKMMNYID